MTDPNFGQVFFRQGRANVRRMLRWLDEEAMRDVTESDCGLDPDDWAEAVTVGLYVPTNKMRNGQLVYRAIPKYKKFCRDCFIVLLSCSPLVWPSDRSPILKQFLLSIDTRDEN